MKTKQLKDFKPGKKFIYTKDESRGVGIVIYEFLDSVLIKFPNGPSAHPNNTNIFRYYEKDFTDFTEFIVI